MLGQKDAHEVLIAAAKCFLGLPFHQLTKEDMATNLDTGLNARTRNFALGHVDAFISHSWRDSAEHKWRALCTYAENHRAEHGTALVLWLGVLKRRPRAMPFTGQSLCSHFAPSSCTRQGLPQPEVHR